MLYYKSICIINRSYLNYILNLKSILVVFLIVIALSCYAQNFDGTNLSSTKPFYGAPPYHFDGNVNYFISFKTDLKVIRALVPEPLTPIPNAEITIVFAKLNAVAPKNCSIMKFI